MGLHISMVEVPLETGADGTVRVRGTRVPLDAVITGFSMGQTPEEIADDFPTLRVPDIYAVLAYYMQRRVEVDEYLREREARARATQAEMEARWSPEGVRERLLARRQRQSSQPDDQTGGR